MDERHEVYVAGEDAQLSGRSGDLVSLLPLTEEVGDVWTEGLPLPVEG